MEVTPTTGRRWLLFDKSALVRAGDISDESLGEPCICPITRLEMLQSARSAADYQHVEEKLAAFHELRMNAETIATAVAAHRGLGQQGHHRLPIPIC